MRVPSFLSVDAMHKGPPSSSFLLPWHMHASNLWKGAVGIFFPLYIGKQEVHFFLLPSSFFQCMKDTHSLYPSMEQRCGHPPPSTYAMHKGALPPSFQCISGKYILSIYGRGKGVYPFLKPQEAKECMSLSFHLPSFSTFCVFW